MNTKYSKNIVSVIWFLSLLMISACNVQGIDLTSGALSGNGQIMSSDVEGVSNTSLEEDDGSIHSDFSEVHETPADQVVLEELNFDGDSVEIDIDEKYYSEDGRGNGASKDQDTDELPNDAEYQDPLGTFSMPVTPSKNDDCSEEEEGNVLLTRASLNNTPIPNLTASRRESVNLSVQTFAARFSLDEDDDDDDDELEALVCEENPESGDLEWRLVESSKKLDELGIELFAGIQNQDEGDDTSHVEIRDGVLAIDKLSLLPGDRVRIEVLSEDSETTIRTVTGRRRLLGL